MPGIKVHVWRPKNGNVGHSSMSLPDGGYISWWPNGECSSTTPSLPAQPHTTFQEDADVEKEQYPPTYHIQVNEEQIQTIKDWWQHFKTEKTYHILTNNCSTVVFLALKMAFPSLQCFEGKVAVWVPLAIQLVAEHLVSRQNNSSEEEEKVYFSDKVNEVTEAAANEATEIARSNGVKSSKVKKVRKLICNPDKALAKKYNEDDCQGKKESNNSKDSEVNKKENEVQHSSKTSKKADETKISKKGTEVQLKSEQSKSIDDIQENSDNNKTADNKEKDVSETLQIGAEVQRKSESTGDETSKKADETENKMSETSTK